MPAYNRDMQQRKTCQLYVYLLTVLGKEVPYTVEECANSYEDLIDCSMELAKELEALKSEEYERLITAEDSTIGNDLALWWEMYQEMDSLRKSMFVVEE